MRIREHLLAGDEADVGEVGREAGLVDAGHHALGAHRAVDAPRRGGAGVADGVEHDRVGDRVERAHGQVLGEVGRADLLCGHVDERCRRRCGSRGMRTALPPRPGNLDRVLVGRVAGHHVVGGLALGQVLDDVGLARGDVDEVAGLELGLVLEVVAPGHAQPPVEDVDRALALGVVVRARAGARRDAEHAHVDVVGSRRGLRDLGAPEDAARDLVLRTGFDDLHRCESTPMPEPVVRPPTPADRDALLALMDAYIVDFYRSPRPPRERLEALVDLLAEGREGTQLVVEARRRPGRLRHALLHLEHPARRPHRDPQRPLPRRPRPRHRRGHGAVPGRPGRHPRARLRGDGVADRGRQPRARRPSTPRWAAPAATGWATRSGETQSPARGSMSMSPRRVS